jgi:uncharacterized protein with PhoU and TrkA domain
MSRATDATEDATEVVMADAKVDRAMRGAIEATEIVAEMVVATEVAEATGIVAETVVAEMSSDATATKAPGPMATVAMVVAVRRASSPEAARPQQHTQHQTHLACNQWRNRLCNRRSLR